MNPALESICARLGALPGASRSEAIPLYPGIALCYVSLTADSIRLPRAPLSHVLQISYCRAGQLNWTAPDGTCAGLHPGDFCLHAAGSGADLQLLLPAGTYQGLVICLDWPEVSAHPPEPLVDAGLFQFWRPAALRRGSAPIFPGKNEQTAGIFSGFYDQPEHLSRPYQRVKTLELLLYLARMDAAPQNRPPEYPTEQLDIVHQIHDQLLQHMDRRITIEELSRQYLINPTTLKAAFKSVYGTSLAAHIKEHRMEQAANLLRQTDLSIAEIAQAVGYDSQSKFTAAFKAYFQILPREFRKR